jgi:deoxycytidylate deaminase
VKVRHFITAKKYSLKSDHPYYRLGAVIVRGNRVIATGWNKYKTSPKSPHPFKHIHAEVAALINCGEKAKGADIYVYREGKDGVPRLSKPCFSCLRAIKSAGIKRVFYTDVSFSCIEFTDGSAEACL